MKITEGGIIIPTVEEIYLKKLNKFKTVKPDLRETDSNVIVSLFKFDAAEEYDLYQEAISAYNNLSIMTAIGQGLNAITNNVGMTWLPAKRAAGKIKIVADIGTRIPQAWGIETLSGKKYVTKNTNEILMEKTILELEVISLETGEDWNTGIGTIIKQTQVLSGIKQITNLELITGGRSRETDAELRIRYLKRVNQKLTFTTEGIKRYLLENTNIIDCRVFENDTDIVNEAGRLPHSYEPVCYGGTDDEIFEALNYYKLAGIRCVGNKTKDFGNITVGFTRAELINIEIQIRIKFKNINPNNTVLVKEVIKKYVEKCTFGETIYRYVIIGELYKLNIGMDILNVSLGEKGNVLNEDYITPGMKVAQINEEDIIIQGENL